MPYTINQDEEMPPPEESQGRIDRAIDKSKREDDRDIPISIRQGNGETEDHQGVL